MKKAGKDSLINHILLYLKDTSENLFDASTTILFNPWKLTKGLSLYKGTTSYHNFKKGISNLKRSPYFIVKNDIFYLSRQGRVEIIKRIIQEKKNSKKWDKKWRAVIFDVPEANRQERNFLRGELKWMGFKELQHSVWITPHDIEKELLFLLKLWHTDFTGDIRFLKIEKITNDGDFKKIFNLQ